jgi:hypothetical protein
VSDQWSPYSTQPLIEQSYILTNVLICNSLPFEAACYLPNNAHRSIISHVRHLRTQRAISWPSKMRSAGASAAALRTARSGATLTSYAMSTGAQTAVPRDRAARASVDRPRNIWQRWRREGRIGSVEIEFVARARIVRMSSRLSLALLVACQLGRYLRSYRPRARDARGLQV